MSDKPHGATRYKAGCRCAECREGKRLEMAAYVVKVRERDGVTPTQKYRPRRSLPAAPCAVCGDLVTGRIRSTTPTHNACRLPRHWKNSVQVSEAARLAIYERDGWVCGFCCDPVDSELKHPDLWAATLDHIVPRSKGGPDEVGNLRLAHRYCNQIRGNSDALTLDDLAA